MKKLDRDEQYLEISLIIVTLGLSCLMWRLTGYKLVVLNLFYLPVVLAGFFLGRYRAGILASLAVIAASIVAATSLSDFAAFSSPLVVGLAVTLWAAVLGLVALLVGTLSDERSRTLKDLHEAHVGVVEVLAKYLQSAHPKLKDRAKRVAHLSESVARELSLPTRDCDDIRVAALLFDLENIEITARVIKKAVGDLETQQQEVQEHSFHGSDLAQSLGVVLSGAFPLLMGQTDAEALGQQRSTVAIPLGAQIIRVVRTYDGYVNDLQWGQGDSRVEDAIKDLRHDKDANHPGHIVDALERVLSREMPNSAEIVLAELV